MKPYIFKYLALAVGITSVVVSVTLGNEDTRFVKPIFHLFLFLFYTWSTKEWNYKLALLLGSVMMGEYFASHNFEMNFVYIAPLFSLFFLMGVIWLRPVLLQTSVRFKWSDILMGIISVSGLLYLISMVFILSANELSDFTLLALATLLFCLFIFSCFYFAGFGKHPKKIFVFITGSGYTLVCLGTFVYELLAHSVVFLGIVNLCEVIAQLSFVYFLVHINEEPQQHKWLV